MSERHSNGQFANGHTPYKNGGRKRRATEERYLDIILEECAPEDARKIVRVAISLAKSGDKAAREWLFNYILGKPVERHEVTGAEGNALVFRVVYDEPEASD